MIIIILRKSLEGSVVDNVLKHGCGAINIDESRIGDLVQDTSKNARSSERHKSTVYKSGLKEEFEGKITTGRWPANFILTPKEKDCPVKSLDAQTGVLHSGKDINPTTSEVSGFFGKTDNYYSSESNYGDSGGASRFFKQFKKEDTQ